MATVNKSNTSSRPKRTSVKELLKVNRKLKLQVQKENKRKEDIARLRSENDELSYRLLELRDKRNDTGECC